MLLVELQKCNAMYWHVYDMVYVLVSCAAPVECVASLVECVVSGSGCRVLFPGHVCGYFGLFIADLEGKDIIIIIVIIIIIIIEPLSLLSFVSVITSSYHYHNSQYYHHHHVIVIDTVVASSEASRRREEEERYWGSFIKAPLKQYYHRMIPEHMNHRAVCTNRIKYIYI